MRILSPDQVRALDERTTAELGLPAVLLMETAGRALAEVAQQRWQTSRGTTARTALILCGQGNNGGDGFVAARWLADAGVQVQVWGIGNADRLSAASHVHLRAIQALDLPCRWLSALEPEVGLALLRSAVRDHDLVIDALTGIGLTGPLREPLHSVVSLLADEVPGLVVAADVPSGLDAKTGAIHGVVVRADVTVAMAAAKPGLWLGEGPACAGDVVVADIGVPQQWLQAATPAGEVLCWPPASLPERSPLAHKNQLGHLLLLAGHSGTAGAAVLAAQAALRSGTGLLTLATSQDVAQLALSSLPDILTRPRPSTTIDWHTLLVGKTALAAGPGMGTGEEAAAQLALALSTSHLPVVLDADALTLLAHQPELAAAARGRLVLTPHPAEMARLLRCSVQDVEADRMGAAQRAATRWGAVVVLKGPRTLVVAPSGDYALWPTPNAALARAGSGDVLTGLIGALLAGGLAPMNAAKLGVAAHAAAGRVLVASHGDRAGTAGDLPDALIPVWRDALPPKVGGAHRRTAVRDRLRRLWFLGVLWLVGCGDGLAVGDRCLHADECGSGLCYVNVCLNPESDSDGDSLTNRLEHRLGSHPFRSDSDGDGKSDAAELTWGGATAQAPADRDNDGKPDLVESAVADSDQDCVADERDSDDATALEDPKALAELVCPAAGICQDQANALLATCDKGAVRCNYSAVPNWHAAEQCDGLDDDCDGATDEGFTYQGVTVGQPCVGTGACGIGAVVCQAGQAVCSTNPGGPQPGTKPEQCNGLDDDCDGVTDEDFSLSGLPVGSPCLGLGKCGVGVVQCDAAGQLACSSDPGGPDSGAGPEICNGQDDDCDGQTDEDLFWQGMAVGASCEVPGICGAGVVVCDAKQSPVCSSAPGQSGSPATAEVCNSKDDDCDGETDESLTLDGLGLGSPCPAKGSCGAGVVVCGSDGAATCSTWPGGPDAQAVAETCNAKDDDCDGQTDEGLLWQGLALGQPCAGIGTCGDGVVVCTDSGLAVCSSWPQGPQSEASPELCNGQDDDCDGVTDNEAQDPPPQTCTGLGVCAGQSLPLVCLAAAWQCDPTAASGYQGPAEFSCDGLDNDCDGLTDESLPQTWTGSVSWDPGTPLGRLGAARAEVAGIDAVVVGGISASLATTPETGSPADTDALWLEPTWLQVAALADAWQWQTQTKQWTKVASDPLLARTGAAVVRADNPPRLWLIGGMGASLEAAEVELATGLVQPAVWPQDAAPLPVAAAVAVQAPGLPHAYVLAPQDGSVQVQRVDLSSGAWTAQVAQPPLTALQSACRAKSGWIYALGRDAAGPRLMAWKPPAALWQDRPLPPVPLQRSLRLWCDPVADEVWLVASEGWWRWLPGALEWLPLDPGALTGQVDPVLVQAPQAAPAGAGNQWHWLAPAGVVPDASAQEVTLAVDATTPTTQGSLVQGIVSLPGPPPQAVAPGAVLVGETDLTHVVQVGGAVWNGSAWQATRGAWWRSVAPGASWSASWQPGGLPARIAPHVVAEPDGPAIQIWGGGSGPLSADDLASGTGWTQVPGGERLDLTTGQWSPLSPAALQSLPALRPYAAIVAGGQPGEWYTFGAAPDGLTQLWRLQVDADTPQLIWQSGQGAGPTFAPGAALSWSALGPALQVATLAKVGAGTQLQRWQLLFGPKSGWTVLSSVTVATGTRLALLTRPGDAAHLLLADNGKGERQAWQWVILGTQTLQPLGLDAAFWLGRAMGAPGGGLLVGGLDGGVPLGNIRALPLACSPQQGP
jgi:hydroxyethylthiazole kinase-like uncharacterized protein yjeF